MDRPMRVIGTKAGQVFEMKNLTKRNRETVQAEQTIACLVPLWNESATKELMVHAKNQAEREQLKKSLDDV